MGVRVEALTVEALTGDALQAALPALADLRITVFRDWPYLYDGTLAYEQRYLAQFAAATGSVIVAARDGERIVGAATAAPMTGHLADFAAPLAARGLDVSRIFYFGESVLLDAYRGQRLGHAFFDQREGHARRLGGYTHAMFCSVIRPDDHPLKPIAYRPLDAFWRTRGYAPVEGATISFPWKDVDQPDETLKPMRYWMREL